MMLKTMSFRATTAEPPRETDVILGRGRQLEAHPGNQALNKLVAHYVPRYYSTTSRKDKKKITMEIVKAARAQGTRFLRQTAIHGWEEADTETVRVRVGQSIRYIHKVQQEERHLQNLVRYQSSSSQPQHQQRQSFNQEVNQTMTFAPKETYNDNVMDVDMLYEGLSEAMRLTDNCLNQLGEEYYLDPLDFSEEFAVQHYSSSYNDFTTGTDSLAQQASTPPSILDFRRSI